LCQGLAGRVLDDLVAAQVLAVLQPAALELNLAAADDINPARKIIMLGSVLVRQHTQYICARSSWQSARGVSPVFA
jgi:hypothetical protein